MYFSTFVLVLLTIASCSGQPRKCDQTPPQAAVRTSIEDQSLFEIKIGNAKNHFTFIPSQTYVLTLETTDPSREFTWFMITAEDPDVDNTLYDFRHKVVDVGSLKTLDNGLFKSRYSERCANTVESFDNVPKPKVESHWVSPSTSGKVRIRAMVAENAEMWYTGENLTIILERDTAPPKDDPPYAPLQNCNLCSEARYEVFFQGRWSRLEHPRHYPSKPDENGYSHMIGASHAFNFTLWEPGSEASPGMAELAIKSNVTVLERHIIDSMSEHDGTRTLIRGKRRHHPNMHKKSHALFRVDRIHHLFSIAVAIRPSPDWFLGTKKFELCTEDGWLKYYKLPLYPWDAGVMDGVSYDSPTSVTSPIDNVKRVEVGSFNIHSPFYQTNLNELKPFAYLEIRRLDVYPLDPRECSDEENTENPDGETKAEKEEGEPEDKAEEPTVAESKQSDCYGEWSEWSPCVPDVGGCGIGAQTRGRVSILRSGKIDQDDIQVFPSSLSSCSANSDSNPMEIKDCIVDC